MKVKEAIHWGIEELKKKDIQEARLKVYILLSHILQKDRSYLLGYEEEEIEKKKQEVYQEGIRKLQDNIPIAYVIRNREFMGLSFEVNEHVLIPQPDTEILVEKVLELTKNTSDLSILDLCTGSGCIGISLAYYHEKANVTLSDISKEALEVAKKNAERLQVSSHTSVIASNLFENIAKDKQFDVIVSNPPYIASAVIPTLDKEVQKEPHLALDGGEDGLSFYKRIIQEAGNYLKEEGYLALEIGYDQKESVMQLMQKTGQYKKITTLQDLAGKDRAIIAKKG